MILEEKQGYKYRKGKAIARVVNLGINDSPDNWTIITDEEASQLKKQWEEERLEQERLKQESLFK